MQRDLYTRLCRPETLKVAVNYVLDDKKDDFVPDVFRHQDYLYNLNANRFWQSQTLRARIGVLVQCESKGARADKSRAYHHPV